LSGLLLILLPNPGFWGVGGSHWVSN